MTLLILIWNNPLVLYCKEGFLHPIVIETRTTVTGFFMRGAQLQSVQSPHELLLPMLVFCVRSARLKGVLLHINL